MKRISKCREFDMGAVFGRRLGIAQTAMLDKACSPLDIRERKFVWGVLMGKPLVDAATDAGYAKNSAYSVSQRQVIADAIEVGQTILDSCKVSGIMERKQTLTRMHRGEIKSTKLTSGPKGIERTEAIENADRLHAIDTLNKMEGMYHDAAGRESNPVVLILDYRRTHKADSATPAEKAQQVPALAVTVGPAKPAIPAQRRGGGIVDPGASEVIYVP